MVWKGFVDLTADVTVLIDGTDYTAYLTQGRIESTLIDSENPLGKLWQGGITLAIDGLTLVDLDPTTNADFNPGNQIEVQANGNTWYWRVAKAVVSQWDSALAAAQTEIEVTCKLGMVNRDFPNNPEVSRNVLIENEGSRTGTLSNVRFSVWTTTLKAELLSAINASGVRILSNSDIDTSGASTTLNATFVGSQLKPDGYNADQNRTFNPYTNAASIASARGFMLYCDPADEIIKIKKYPLYADEATLAGRYALEQLASIQPSVLPLDDAVESVVATVYDIEVVEDDEMISYPLTTVLAAAPAISSKFVDGSFVEPGDAIVVCERIEQRPVETDRVFRQQYIIRARRFWIFPTVIGDNVGAFLANAYNWVTVASGTIEQIFNKDGNPISDNNIAAIIRGCDVVDGMPTYYLSPFHPFYGNTALVPGQGTRESYVYAQNSVLTLREKKTFGTFDFLNIVGATGELEQLLMGVTVKHIEREVNKYRPDGRYQQIVSYLSAQILDDGTNPVIRMVASKRQKPIGRTIDGVPRPPSIKPSKATEVSTKTKEESIQGNLGKGRKFSTQRAWGTDGQHATAIARMILALKQTGQLSLDVERAVVSGESLTPARMEHVGDRALIRDAEYLEFAPRRIVFGYTGREAGRLGSAVTVPKRPINTTGGLQAGPMGDLV